MIQTDARATAHAEVLRKVFDLTGHGLPRRLLAVEGQTGSAAKASLSELASQIRRRADGRCEDCHSPESAFPRPFHIEHTVAKQHGGLTRLDNLALACWTCNEEGAESDWD